MRGRHRRALSVPIFATHFPSLSSSTNLNNNIYMFAEDIHLAVMPFRGITEKQKDFSVTLTGEVRDRERASYIIGDLGEFDKYDLPNMICDAIDNIAKHLAWEGCSVYEIASNAEGEVNLHSFTPKRLIKLLGWFLQVIPRGDWQLWKKKWVIVPVCKVWRIEMPSALSGYKGYRNILKKLRMFEHLGPSFWRKDLEIGVRSQIFDFQKYVRNTDIYYRRVTRIWGWNRRDWSQDRSTEFYSFYKMVTFRWAQSVLREHIITELNALFHRLGIVCELKVSGLPTSSEILKVREDLQKGTITFSQASERVSLL